MGRRNGTPWSSVLAGPAIGPPVIPVVGAFKIGGQAAANRMTVPIRRESGTGKELIAQATNFDSAAARDPSSH